MVTLIINYLSRLNEKLYCFACFLVTLIINHLHNDYHIITNMPSKPLLDHVFFLLDTVSEPGYNARLRAEAAHASRPPTTPHGHYIPTLFKRLSLNHPTGVCASWRTLRAVVSWVKKISINLFTIGII